MELLTDILAIAGWALFGLVIPASLCVFRKDETKVSAGVLFSYSISFGLIAASLVLG